MLRAARGLRRNASADRLASAALAPAPPPLPLPPPLPARDAGRAAAAAGRRRRLGLALRFRGLPVPGLPVPSEMWGAAALAARLTHGSEGLQLPRGASVIAQAFSSAAAVPPPSGPVSEDHPKALAEALEWRPQLGLAEDALCLLGPAAACAGVYALTAPTSVQPLYAAGMALLYALLLAVTRTWLLERRYRAVQRSERELAGADGRFFKADGIELHYKRCAPLRAGSGGGVGGAAAQQQQQRQAEPLAVHCLHGFGASSYSWSFVQHELADALGAVVTAHDMPGFGLSQRPRSPAYYTLHFNGDAARSILDAELAAQQAQQAQQQGEWRSHPIATPSSSSSSSSSSLDSLAAEGDGSSGDGSGSGSSGRASPSSSATASSGAPPAGEPAQHQRIFVGHSMGAAAAAEGVISRPEGVAALVLVAPAIVALWLGPPEEASGDAVATGLAVVEELVSAEDAPGELQRLASSPSSGALLGRSPSTASAAGSTSGGGGGGGGTAGLAARGRRLLRVAVAVLKASWFLLARALLAAASPLLVVLLRRLVRSRRFWERGLASAWHSGQRVTREYVDAYRSGQLVRGWEGGILRFLSARFAEKHGFWGSIREAVQGSGHLTQAERLARAVRRHNIRVLIVHGDGDALVPAANSRRLAALLPNAELVVFEGCGHMPQEECPERFVETVQRFVASLDGVEPQPQPQPQPQAEG